MKRILTAMLFLLCCSLPCYAMEFVDEFTSIQETEAAVYQNLVPRSADPMDDFIWAAAPDQTFCTLASPDGTGSVLYQIRGAQKLEVALYSRQGTFASFSDSLSAYTLGYFFEADAAANRKEPLLSPSTGCVYLREENGYSRLTWVTGGMAFLPTEEKPEDLVPYGLQVYAGKSEGNLRLISPTRKREKESQFIRPGQVIQYHDVFSYTLPADTQWVKLVLQNYARLPLENGSFRPNTTQNSLRLASAVFTGENISTGQPPEEPSSSIPPSSSEIPPSSSTDGGGNSHGGGGDDDPDLEPPPKKDNGSSSDKGLESKPASSPSRPTSSSKTAGASSSKLQEKVSAASSSSAKSSSSSRESQVSSSTLVISPEEDPPKSSHSGFYLAAAVYLSAAAAGLLLWWEKKSSPQEKDPPDSPN